MEFNTVSISDGITMGSAGMRASLVSREVITDSIELVARGNLFDALVVLVGCDKTIPAAAMALARLDIPGLILYGGSIAPGRRRRARRHHPGRLRGDRRPRVRQAVGRGRCAKWKIAPARAPARAAASSPPTRWRRRSSSSGWPSSAAATCRPAIPKKHDVARRSGALIMDVLRAGRRPSHIVTRDALENAIASVAATGGSTNAVLHLVAIAREMGVPLDARRLRSRQRARAGLRRSEAGRPLRRHRPLRGGRHAARRAPAARRRARCTATRVTVTGRTIAEEASPAVETPGQEVVRPLGVAAQAVRRPGDPAEATSRPTGAS